jgi:hypothetical protein
VPLSTTKRNNLTIAQYVGKMKALANDMSSAGNKIYEDDLASLRHYQQIRLDIWYHQGRGSM